MLTKYDDNRQQKLSRVGEKGETSRAARFAFQSAAALDQTRGKMLIDREVRSWSKRKEGLTGVAHSSFPGRLSVLNHNALTL